MIVMLEESRMERDFMGLSGKEVKGEGGGRHDSALQWPFAPQQFISHEAMRQLSPINGRLDRCSAPGYLHVLTMDSCDAKSNTELPLLQKPFSAESSGKQGTHQFALQSFHSPNSDSFGALKYEVHENRACQILPHHSIPILDGSPFFMVRSARNGPDLAVTGLKHQPFLGGITTVNSPAAGSTGAFAPRIMSKPLTMTSQLTIFYAGAVNVYNDIPLDKAQAIMSSASKVASDVMSSRFERLPGEVTMVDGVSTDQSQIQTLNHKTSPCPMLPSLISAASSGSRIANDIPWSKATGTAVPTKPTIQRAVPQARNASLARFLERRKERVSNALPYGCPNKIPEGNPRLSDNNSGRKTSLLDIASSSNPEHLGEAWSPNTKLEI